MNESSSAILSQTNNSDIVTESDVEQETENITVQFLTEDRQPLISDNIQYYLNIYFISVALTIISFFGVVTNTINSAVFLKQGIRDSVSLSLFALTVSDFGVVFCALTFSLCFAARTIDNTLTFDPYGFQLIMRWPRSMFFVISMSITAFISVERCLCVVLPFRFRSMFTLRRTTVMITSIFVFFIVSYSPIYATYGLSWQFDSRTNKSRIMGWVSENRSEIEMYCNLFNQIGLLTVCQIIIVVSTVIMVSGLKFSNRFRQQKSTIGMKTSQDGHAAMAKSDRKEARVIKMVSILTTICIACTMVQLSVVYARRIVVEISSVGIYQNLYNNLANSALISGALNASLNIFVYYNLKPKFRETLFNMFSCQVINITTGDPQPPSDNEIRTTKY